jgi:tRNA(fMet)-specific endonuclease VapC
VGVLLDTNIVSQLMREPTGPIRRRLGEHLGGTAAMSIVTLAELRFGVERKASERLRLALEALTNFLPALPLEPPVDHTYAQLRAHLERTGQPIGPNDMWIAAHALSLGLILVTANVREFSRVPGLAVENWLD